MGRVGVPELLVILVIILLLFGARRLPEIGSAIGKAIQEFRKASKETKEKDGPKDFSEDPKE